MDRFTPGPHLHPPHSPGCSELLPLESQAVDSAPKLPNSRLARSLGAAGTQASSGSAAGRIHWALERGLKPWCKCGPWDRRWSPPLSRLPGTLSHAEPEERKLSKFATQELHRSPLPARSPATRGGGAAGSRTAFAVPPAQP